jgi:hypothetical protein
MSTAGGAHLSGRPASCTALASLPPGYPQARTLAWILAVRNFMESSPASASVHAFIAHNPALLDSKTMLTHYSASLLVSEAALAQFVEPDLDQIPRHLGPPPPPPDSA